MEKKMKVQGKLAISASSAKADGNVDSRFGRCPYFLIVTINDSKVEKTEEIENSEINARGGAGASAATLLAKRDVKALITGNVGPRALEVLKQFDIEVYNFEGTVEEAIKGYIEKNLKKNEE